ncbi:MAG: extracellular solute-binding protein [Spirochaetales bacterium]|nr:extracellular solute-binding protein [Spirochaetales bacterium]
MASCGPKPLDPRGEVNLWAPQEIAELHAAADSFEGLSLNLTIAGESWLTRLKQKKEPPDLIYTDWNWDVAEGFHAGMLLDLSSYFDRMPVTDKIRPIFLRQSIVNPGVKYFLPAAAYSWGLFYNTAILAYYDIQIPESWDGWPGFLEALKGNGVVPIALGASTGWPALGWLSYLDLRLNGSVKHFELLEGSRPFDDPSMTVVYDTFAGWRDKGYFNADASKMNWITSLELVGSGRAACVLMGSFSAPRFANKDHIAFAPVPTAGSAGDSGELAVVEAFLITREAQAPEAALSLAQEYVATGIPRQTRGRYLLSVLELGDAVTAVHEDLTAVQLEIFRSAGFLLPQMDRYLPAQAAYDINRVMARFLNPDFDMSAADLARILKNIRP